MRSDRTGGRRAARSARLTRRPGRPSPTAVPTRRRGAGPGLSMRLPRRGRGRTGPTSRGGQARPGSREDDPLPTSAAPARRVGLVRGRLRRGGGVPRGGGHDAPARICLRAGPLARRRREHARPCGHLRGGGPVRPPAAPVARAPAAVAGRRIGAGPAGERTRTAGLVDADAVGVLHPDVAGLQRAGGGRPRPVPPRPSPRDTWARSSFGSASPCRRAACRSWAQSRP